MNIYLLTLEIEGYNDVLLSAAVVTAESPAQATELIVRHLNEDWEGATVEQIGIAIPGSKPIVVMTDDEP